MDHIDHLSKIIALCNSFLNWSRELKGLHDDQQNEVNRVVRKVEDTKQKALRQISSDIFLRGTSPAQKEEIEAFNNVLKNYYKNPTAESLTIVIQSCNQLLTVSSDQKLIQEILTIQKKAIDNLPWDRAVLVQPSKKFINNQEEIASSLNKLLETYRNKPSTTNLQKIISYCDKQIGKIPFKERKNWFVDRLLDIQKKATAIQFLPSQTSYLKTRWEVLKNILIASSEEQFTTMLRDQTPYREKIHFSKWMNFLPPDETYYLTLSEIMNDEQNLSANETHENLYSQTFEKSAVTFDEAKMAEYYTSLGKQLYNEGKLKEALILFDRATELNHPMACILRAYYILDNGKQADNEIQYLHAYRTLSDIAEGKEKLPNGKDFSNEDKFLAHKFLEIINKRVALTNLKGEANNEYDKDQFQKINMHKNNATRIGIHLLANLNREIELYQHYVNQNKDVMLINGEEADNLKNSSEEWLLYCQLQIKKAQSEIATPIPEIKKETTTSDVSNLDLTQFVKELKQALTNYISSETSFLNEFKKNKVNKERPIITELIQSINKIVASNKDFTPESYQNLLQAIDTAKKNMVQETQFSKSKLMDILTKYHDELANFHPGFKLAS